MEMLEEADAGEKRDDIECPALTLPHFEHGA
jgi:hypothetical protein